jgi:hypothetical protein
MVKELVSQKKPIPRVTQAEIIDKSPGEKPPMDPLIHPVKRRSALPSQAAVSETLTPTALRPSPYLFGV